MDKKQKGPGEINVMGRLRQGLLYAFGMVVLAIAMGSAFNMLRPAGIPFVGTWDPSAVSSLLTADLPSVSLEQAGRLFLEKKAVFIDARPSSDYRSGHIPGALNAPPDDLAAHLHEIRTILKTGKIMIVYCTGLDCPLSAYLVRRLRSLGMTEVKVCPEGWAGWNDAGHPVE
jgi:rhodanese-related sulfurtransferase